MTNELIDKFKVFDDNDFKFNESSHTYTYKDEVYPSVTTFLKNFCEQFDTAYWSKKKAKERLAKERGFTSYQSISDNDIELPKIIEQVIYEWDTKRDYSCDLGTNIHKYIEERFKGNLLDKKLFDIEVNRRIEKFEKLYETKLKDLTPVAQELRVFSKKMKLAGTIDALFMYKDKLMILDWKSNNKLTTDVDRNFQKLKTPFQDEWENEHNKYSIQLNLYKMILAEYDIKVYDCAIVHIPPSVQEPKILRVKNYEPQLKEYFGFN